MKALVYTGPESLEYLDVPDPDVASGEQLIRITYVGICGSDMHAYLGHDDRRPAPLILGHEVAGEIVGGTRHGERVTVNPLVTCGTCPACRDGRDNLCPERQIISMPPREGGFAELVAMPDSNLVTVPDDVSLTKAALAEPIACGWHAARLSLAALSGAGDKALVLGGGAIGLGAALSLRAQGVGNVMIVEPNPARRAYLINHCGQTVTNHPTNETLFDLVIDGVGYATTRATASACVRPGGVIGHIGLGEDTGGLDIRRMTLQEINFIGTYTYTAEDFLQTAQAIYDGRLGRLDWAEIRPLSAGAEAFSDIRRGVVAAPKILLRPEITPERI
ncbi:galactitol-1-phosphate 5-dehydrogenase [Sedimentitalea sp. CY04]|uniref:Galactitol-1-phosphate 5-dehydrogenase n=1 Tax=Parasedimentitalea denitrificans TaxID=2211118 RepID=A0ABX0WCT0_9RHOB|nr:alcohol dehydrogenase catalytic domain-containing protein [Sedimentitalea sp. CY04]NIZ63449.1 galactitol-1-phosphate 5-dehydrogenase [Sedimentitalea sp. CY04]